MFAATSTTTTAPSTTTTTATSTTAEAAGALSHTQYANLLNLNIILSGCQISKCSKFAIRPRSKNNLEDFVEKIYRDGKVDDEGSQPPPPPGSSGASSQGMPPWKSIRCLTIWVWADDLGSPVQVSIQKYVMLNFMGMGRRHRQSSLGQCSKVCNA